MNAPQLHPRREPTERILNLAVALAEGLQRSGLSDERIAEIAVSGISGECPQCHARITGKDLVEIATVVGEADGLTPRLARLRNGYCARNACDARFYELAFQNQPDLDWRPILDRSDRIDTRSLRQAEAVDPDVVAKSADARSRFHRSMGLRILVPLLLLLTLLLARHWYRGGTIMFLREPEEFRVDPLPPGEHDWGMGPPDRFKP